MKIIKYVSTGKLIILEIIPITLEDGQRYYYDDLKFWKSWVSNSNRRIIPKIEEFREFLLLKQENPSFLRDITARKNYNQLQEYNNRYDWRPKKYSVGESVGLMSP